MSHEPPTNSLQDTKREEHLPPQSDGSQIVQFYEDRCVLVTGASGFLGKLIIEKLLRTCRGIRKIFVLVRPKRNKSARERLQELFNSVIFDQLKAEDAGANFERLKEKIALVEGNLTEPLLGLNIERQLQLADEVSVVLHSAAVVNFGGNIKSSLNPNLIGTRNMLELVSKFSKLRAFIHVSTSYSNCMERSTGEYIYPTNMDPKQLIEISELLDEETLETMRDKLLGMHPNAYTYTKQQAEFLCGSYAIGCQQLPVLICRPSVIVSTYREPITGFIDNRNAGNGIFDGLSRGVLRTCLGNPDALMDIVPADYVSNCIIALAWFANLYHRVRAKFELEPEMHRFLSDERTCIDDAQLEQKMIDFYRSRQRKLQPIARGFTNFEPRLMQVPVVHVTSGVENPVKYDQIFRYVAEHTLELPSSELFRNPRCSMHTNFYVWRLCALFYHSLVGRLLDWFSAAPQDQVGKRSSSWSREFQRIDKFVSVLAYFLSNSFRFEAENRPELIDQFMTPKDRNLFPCDMRTINWKSFAREITLGIRRHLIGETDDTLPGTRSKLRLTLWRNSMLQTAPMALLCCVVLWVFTGYSS